MKTKQKDKAVRSNVLTQKQFQTAGTAASGQLSAIKRKMK